MEKNLRRALTISDGDMSILYGSPLAVIFLSMAVAGFVLPIFIAKFVTPRRVVTETHGDGTSD
jgi:putative tricarboxylic transport membrane protein